MNKTIPTVIAFLSLQISKLKELLSSFSPMYKENYVLLSIPNGQNRKGFSKTFGFLLVLLFANFVNAQTNTWDGSSSTNWNTPANWSRNEVPLSAHDVVIPNATRKPIISVAGAVCNTLTITNTGTGDNTLTINSPGTLIVSGAITMTSPTNNSRTTIINVVSGTLNATSVSMNNSTADSRDSSLRIGSTGVINVSVNITMLGSALRNDITFSGAGTLNVGGTITGGTLVPSTGTVNYNNGGAQTVGTYTYNNLTLSGSGTKTFGASVAVSGNWSMTAGVLADLGGFTHTAGTLVLGGAGPLLSSWGSTASGAANTTNDYFTGTGIINVSSAPYPAIDNNYASYSSGVSGQVAGSSGEYADSPTNSIPGSLTLAAPAGSAFINVKFASYGSPGGTSPNFTIGTCHAFNSRTVTTGLLGNNIATIPPSGTFNSTFGDPCFGIVKSYNVVATYAEPFCATSPVASFVIDGSTPTGGNGTYAFLWEVSTTGHSSGYAPASGTNNAEDYTVPAGINTTTYYRRTVTSGIYSDATIVIVQVTPGPPVQPTAFTSVTNCDGTATLSVSGGSLGLGGYVEFYSGSCGGTVVGTSNVIPANLVVSPTMGNTTYYVRYKNSCNKVATCLNTTVTNPVSITAAANATAVCFNTVSQNASLAYTATAGTPDRYSITWNAAAITAGLVNQTNVTFGFVAAGGTLNTIAIPANVPAGTYTGTLTVKNNTSGCVSFMNTFTVTVNALPTVTSTAPGSKTYTGTANATTVSAVASAGATIDWYDLASGGNLLGSGSLTYAPTGINVGTYTVYAQARNTTTGCVSTSRTAATLTITAATLTVTANTATHVYGATLTPGAGATPLSVTGMQNSESLAGTVTVAYTAGNTGASAVGSYSGAVSPSAFVKTSGTAVLSNYSITYVTNNLSVTAATLTVTANTATHVYGATLTPGAGATPLSVTGMQNSESLAGTVTLAYTAGNTAASAVGSYSGAVSPSAFVKTSGTAVLSNYSITYVTNNLSVTAATLTVTANTATHVYGATLVPGAGATPLSVTGMQNSESLAGTVTLAYTAGNTAASAVGSYSGAVSPSAFVKTSGTAVLSNYSITYVTNNLSVTAATLIVTANTATHVYGATLTPGAGATPLSVTGMQNSESLAGTVTLAYTAGNTAASAVGSYSGAVSPSAFVKTSGTAVLSNYSITYVTNNLSVTAATLTVTANTATHVYGATLTPGAGATPLSVTGMQNSESLAGTVTLAYTAGNTAASAVGSYSGAVSPSAFVKTSGTAVLSNYSITYVTNNLSVTAATLTVTANTATHVYGATLTPGAGATPLSVTGMQNSESLAGTVTLAYTAGNTGASAVGSYSGAVSPSAFVKTSGTAVLSNYSITYVTNNLSVTAATLTVTANTATHVYGATLTPGAGATPLSITGMQNSESLAGTVTLAYTAGNTGASAVGSYSGAVSPSAFVKTSGTAVLSNYSITYVTNNLSVTAATLTVTANTATHVYGATLTPGAGATPLSITGMQNSESLAGTVTLAYTAGNAATSAVGTYNGSVSPSAFVKTSGTAVLSNYSITYVTNNLSVTAATLTVTANNRSKCYGTALTLGTTAFTTSALQNGETITNVTLTSAGGHDTSLTQPASLYIGNIIPSNPTGIGFSASNYVITMVSGDLTILVDSGILSINGDARPTGNVTYCPSTLATFSIPAVPGATYTWIVPTGWKTEAGVAITGPVAGGSNELKVITGTTADSGSVSVTIDAFCPSNLGVTLSTIAPIAPTVTPTALTCAVPSGTITITSPAPAAGTVYTLTGINPAVAAVTNTSGEFTGLAAGDYVVTCQQGSGCVSTPTATISLAALVTKTWNGAWSPAPGVEPTINDYVVFAGDYDKLGSVDACSCKVNTGATVTVKSGDVFVIENGLTVEGDMIFENGASLVQHNPLAANVGSITYKRSSSALKAFDYVYWSSPLKNQTIETVFPGSNKMWFYQENLWIPATSTMIPAKGYIVRYSGATTQNAVFVGEPNNGDYLMPVQGLGNNLIGNPYPSAISADDFMIANITVIADYGSLSFWTHNTARTENGTDTKYIYATDDYAMYNLSGSTAAGSGGVPPDGNIASGQSFFVPSKVGSVSFNFTNSMRITDIESNSQFFKQSSTKKGAKGKIEKNRVWLNLTNDEGAFKQLLVGYIQGATNSHDKLYDGKTLDGNAFVDFYSNEGMSNYTIQARGLPFNAEDEVPLGFKTTIAGTFKIAIDKTDGFLTNQAIYLEDKTTNTVHDLKSGAYSFTTAKGEFKDRFVLRYNDSKLGTGDFDPKAKGVIVSVKNRQIKINSFDQTFTTVKLFDLKGSLVYEKNKVNKNEFIIDNLTSATQFMIVMVQLEDGKWITEEIIFHD